MQDFVIQATQRVEPGTYTATVRNIRLNSEKNVAFINYKLHDGKEIPASSYNLAHPTGVSLFCDALVMLGFKNGDAVKWDESIACDKAVNVRVAHNGEFLNTNIQYGS